MSLHRGYVPGHWQHRSHHQGVLLWIGPTRENLGAGVSHGESSRTDSVPLHVSKSKRSVAFESVRSIDDLILSGSLYLASLSDD